MRPALFRIRVFPARSVGRLDPRTKLGDARVARIPCLKPRQIGSRQFAIAQLRKRGGVDIRSLGLVAQFFLPRLQERAHLFPFAPRRGQAGLEDGESQVASQGGFIGAQEILQRVQLAQLAKRIRLADDCGGMVRTLFEDRIEMRQGTVGRFLCKSEASHREARADGIRRSLGRTAGKLARFRCVPVRECEQGIIRQDGSIAG